MASGLQEQRVGEDGADRGSGEQACKHVFRAVQENAHHEAALRSASIAAAFAPRRRRRGISSSSSIRLGTFLHLMRLDPVTPDRSAGFSVATLVRRRQQSARKSSGKVTVTVVPSPTVLCTFISPSCRSDQPLHDRQTEAGAFVLAADRSCRPGRTDRRSAPDRSAAIPTPVSVTHSISRDPSTAAETVTLPPRSVNLIALATRFGTICLNARGITGHDTAGLPAR